MSTLPSDRFDVVIVGAGPAGVTAAVALGRAGFSVLLCEAGIFPGAENWSGAVYFAENLEHAEAFGPEVISSAPYERRVVERGAYLYNGHTLLGASLRSEDAFRSCYTVLRPVYDRYLAERAREHGVTLACETTVQSLIRHEGRVIGVHTERGPAYADVVFLAEGDASHLVTQEGYERVSEQGEQTTPHFLQGVKEVISLPAGAIEERFGVAAGEGVALEMLLRNATRKGRTVRLNMGGFLYTNRDSVSLGFVLPLDNLKEQFDGDHNLLMEWFKGLPEIARLIDGGELTSYGAKIIRGGGHREIPRLVDDGLAIGGAASGIGLDFPYPNFTGPATAMGLYFARAVREIAAAAGGPQAGGDPTRTPYTEEALRRTYLRALHASHYYRNVETLRDWPSYIERTHFLFEQQIDLVNNAAYVVSRPDRGALSRAWELVRVLRRVVPARRLPSVLADARRLGRTVGVGRLFAAALAPANLVRMAANTLLALLPSRRARIGAGQQDGALAGAGVAEAAAASGARLRAVFRVAAGGEPAGRMPWPARWLWHRYGPALADAFVQVYTNDDTPIGDKLAAAARHFGARASIWDGVVKLALLATLALLGALQALVEWYQHSVLHWDLARFRERFGNRLLQDNRDRIRLDDGRVRIATPYDTKLATITYHPGHHSHIKVFWPEQLSERARLADSPLWSVCPAKVYEVRRNRSGQPGVVVNFENCVKCETCWRATDDVHWSRATQQRLIYQVYSPTQQQLHRYLLERPEPHPRLPSRPPLWRPLLERVAAVEPRPPAAALAAVRACVDRFEALVRVYGDDLGRSPLVLERGRRDHLEQLLARAADAFRAAQRAWAAEALAGLRDAAGEPFEALWRDAVERLEQIQAHARAGRFFWAEVLGEQLLDHHLRGVRGAIDAVLSGAPAEPGAGADPATESWRRCLLWRSIEVRRAVLEGEREAIRARREELFDGHAVRALEQGEPLSAEQVAWLREQVARAAGRRREATYTRRDVLLEELASADPAIAYLVSSHLLAADLLEEADAAHAEPYRSGRAWAAAVPWGVRRAELDGRGEVRLYGHADFVPTALAQAFLVIVHDQGYLVRRDAPGVELEDVGTVGLIGAGIRRLRLRAARPELAVQLAGLVDPVSLEQPAAGEPMAPVLGVALPDLLALVRGAGEYLLGRAREHAAGRVQFPGAFEDEAGRETIAKFGAVKQMLAEMESSRFLLEALSLIGPAGEEDAWSGVAAAKVLASDAFGPAPGSFTYNTGQIFGGTAFSEDDVIAKYYRDSAPFRFLYGHDDALREQVGRRRIGAVRRGEALLPLTDEERLCLATAAEHPLLREPAERFEQTRERIARWAESLAGEQEDPVAAYLLGGAVVRALAVKAALVRAVWRIESGIPAEAIVEATRLLADRLLADLPALLGERDLLAATLAGGDELLAEGEPFPAPEIPDAEPYEAVKGAERRYDSGRWLLPFDAEPLRYVPEILANDEKLMAYWRSLESEFRARYVQRRFDGLIYNRYLEKLHLIPQEDLDYMVERGFMRMPIPKRLGGEEALKAEYYILCKLIGRFGDAALSLAIMANTSIGTTPALIGLFQELPRARAELEKVRAHPEVLGNLRDGIDRLLAMQQRPDLQALTAGYQEVAALVQQRVLKSTVLKYLGSGFLRAFFKAGQAGRERDLAGFFRGLARARELLDAILVGVDERLAEYPRRERGHELFLKMISAGYVSAFALTEPTAGSDSGGVKTFARLDSRRVHRDEDGVLYFFLDEQERHGRRNLLDADRLEFDFDGHRLLYRYADDAPPAVIDHSEYDYQKDSPERTRFYMHGDRKVHFTDIAQIRTDGDGNPVYEFWVLNGAKMWITNGRFAHCMALYARTDPEGVTGFMVDRHAEGFVVGADEDKLGQRGSPTNELSLNNVRVPREMILGFRGRGQVNALETLNTGRAGLCVTTHATIQEMTEDVVVYARGERSSLLAYEPREPARPLERYWLGRLDEELVATAATTYELVGLMDNPRTASVRMESAIGKYYGAEAEHEVIDWMERLRGLEGQTWLHRIEKTRRDARVLNIYEGTNEVQRFLVLRDLVQRVLPVWQKFEARGALPEGSAHADLVREFEEIKQRLRGSLEDAVDRFGQQVWANVSLQPVFFRLAEIAGLTKVVDAVLYRLEWCARHRVPEAHRERIERAGRRTVRRAFARIEALERHYAIGWEYLLHNRYPPATQLGFLSLEQGGAPAEGWGRVPARCLPEPTREPLQRPVRIAVLLKPVPVAAPRPRVADGAFAEPLYALADADEAALATALRLKERDPQRVRVTAYTLAGARGPEALRAALARGVDRAVLLELDAEAAGGEHDPRFVGEVVAGALRRDPADLVLCGDAAADTGQGLVPGYLGTRLGIDVVARVDSVRWGDEQASLLEVQAAAWRGLHLKQALPCVVATSAAAAGGAHAFSLGALLAAAAAEIERVPAASLVDGLRPLRVRHEPRILALSEFAGRRATTPEEAAAVLLQVASGLGGGAAVDTPPYAERMLGLGEQPAEETAVCLFVAEPQVDGILAAGTRTDLENAARVAGLVGLPLDVVVPVDGDERAAAAVAGAALGACEPRRAVFVTMAGAATFGPEGHLEWWQELWAMLRARPRWLLGPGWANDLFARFLAAGVPDVAPERCWSWYNADAIARIDGRVRVATGVYGGAARAEIEMPADDGLHVLTFTRALELERGDVGYAVPGSAGSEVYVWSPKLRYDPASDAFAQLLRRLGGGEMTLADAEFIIDVGYGVGTREGLDELAEPLRRILAEELGLPKVMIGATRKVTQDLELLPMDRQIGQTGVAVNPRLIIALAVSGAPQHVDYIGERAVILSFNIDPDAPLMRLNDVRPKPIVHPIVGDVWQTVPRFIEALRKRLRQSA